MNTGFAISLVIICGGDLLRLKHCLAHVQAMKLQPNEIVVVLDAAPGDKSITEIESVRRPATEQLPPIHVIVLDPLSAEFRPGKARNAGAAATAPSGNLLVFLDGDCLPDPDFLEAHYFNRPPHALAASMRRRYPEPTEKQLRGNLVSSDLIAGAEMEPRQFTFMWATAPKPHQIYGFGLSIDHLDFNAIGGFDESLDGKWGSSEDVDFAARHERNGGRLVALADRGFVTHLDHPKLEPRADFNEVLRDVLSGNRPLVANQPEQPQEKPAEAEIQTSPVEAVSAEGA